MTCHTTGFQVGEGAIFFPISPLVVIITLKLFGSYPYLFTTRAQILSYKGVGLNGGVILYNFTRLRSLPGGGMTEAIRFVWRRYRSDIRLADQDILNIIFGVSTQ